MKNHLSFLSVLLCSLALLNACSQAMKENDRPLAAVPSQSERIGGEEKDKKIITDEAPAAEAKTSDVPKEAAVSRKLIKQGDIKFETTSVEDTKLLIEKAAQKISGYVSKVEVYSYENMTEHRLMVRMPAQNFDAFLQEISAAAVKIDNENINVSDVTEEFLDAEARLKNKKDLEARYKEILKKANTVEEMLNVESEINTLREDIESVEGRLKYLNDQVAFSTLTISYYQQGKTKTAIGFFGKLKPAITNGWDYFLGFIIGIMNAWPFILIVAGGIYLGFKLDKRRKSKKADK